jgi:cell volume regulation protein A
MQDAAEVIGVVGVIVFLAHFFTGVFSRTKIPDVLFLIAIGIFLGPVLTLVSPAQFGQVGPVFATITLVIIMFECGITLKLSTLRTAIGGSLGLTFLTFAVTTVIVSALTFWLTDLDLLPSFILGALFGTTAEAIVIPLTRQLKMQEESQTILSIEATVTSVLSIIITIALIEAAEGGGIQVVSVTRNILSSFVVSIFLGIIGALAWSLVLHRIHAAKNTLLTTPAFVFVIFGIAEVLGFNGAMAALAFGVTMGNIESIHSLLFKEETNTKHSGFTETEKVLFGEVAFLLRTFFFVYLGISLELISTSLMIVAIVIMIVTFLIRIVAAKLTVSSSIQAKDASLMAVMIPRGLTTMVLASLPLQHGIVGGELLKNLAYGLVLVSIVMSSILVLLLAKTRLSDYYGRLFACRGTAFLKQSLMRIGRRNHKAVRMH